MPLASSTPKAGAVFVAAAVPLTCALGILHGSAKVVGLSSWRG